MPVPITAMPVIASSSVPQPSRRAQRRLIKCSLFNLEAAMGRFYFHLRADDHVSHDDQGQDLPDLFAARREAIQSAREILAGAIRAGYTSVPDAVVIIDEAGRLLETVRLATVLPEPVKYGHLGWRPL
jgi:hypothetical protein